ncbi:DUF3081 family protein [Shewanella sp. 202IG2-18]|nr:DUF3081 family protein [Parashewanella hymeniacidonis]
MENQIDVKHCLNVFNLVRTHGEKHQSVYSFKGFKAWTDFDGYTCYLQYGNATLTLLFHGKYHFDYSSHHDFDLFMKKISQLVSN